MIGVTGGRFVCADCKRQWNILAYDEIKRAGYALAALLPQTLRTNSRPVEVPALSRPCLCGGTVQFLAYSIARHFVARRVR